MRDGLDNIPAAATMRPPLTTVAFDCELIGASGVEATPRGGGTDLAQIRPQHATPTVCPSWMVAMCVISYAAGV